ncbi:AsmA family protein [Azospira restricta]|uniref:AsmA family protein n=1 Tax=Azospira restricta TaxID=404405 RepID=A0A974SSE1_9RHOO|nr:AsmA family protein [Azospira restricta]QRJ65534.1 AsmA family protein [Azospira restricta]
MTRRRWLFWSLPLLHVAALAASEAGGWFFLRAPAEAVLSAQLGREVRIAAPFRLHFRRTLHVDAGGLWVAAPAGFSVPHLIDADGLTLRLRYRDLLALREPSAPLRVAALGARRFDLRLVRLADGRASWQFAAESTRPPPTVERLGVQQGGIVLRDPLLAVDLDSTLAPRDNASPAVVAEISGRLRERPLRARVTLPDGPPRVPTEKAGEPIAVEGQADYAGLHLDFAGTLVADALRGTVAVRGPSLSLLGRLFDTTLPTTAPFRLQGSVARDFGESPQWRITVASARVGRSDLAGEFTYDAAASPPRLDGTLTGRNFVLADLAPAFGTRDADGAVVRPAGGRTLPDRPLDLPSLTRLDAGIAIDLRQVDLGAAFRQPIAPLRARLTLAGGRLTLADIDARSARGRLSGTLAVDASQPRPQWRADLGWDGVRLDRWLKAAQAADDDIRRRGDEAPPPWFTGTLHGRTRLVGHGRSSAELLASLDGRASLSVRDGSLSHLLLEGLGLDVAQGLGLLLRGDDRQPVQCAVIDLEAKRGRVTPRVAVIATPVTVVMVDGSIDFARERLDLRVAAKPQNVSPLTLRSPFHVRGSFADPELAPATAPIAARAAGALGLALLNPLAAILPFIDPGERDPAACSQALAGQVAQAAPTPRP